MNPCQSIKEIRVTLGLSQVAFADKLHVSFSTVNRWENGRVLPNRLAAIAIITLAEEKNIDQKLVDNLKNLISYR